MYMLNSYAVGSYDPDAIAFFNATGITSVPDKDAINTYVVGLKTNSLWTPIKGLWIMAGGSLTTCKYNLKDPRDLDAAFRLTYGSTVTAGANGISATTANAVNGTADTHFVPSVQFANNGFSAGVINHTAPNLDNAPGGSFFGAAGAGSTNCPRFTRTNATTWICAAGGNSRSVTVSSLANQFLSISNTPSPTNTAQPYLNGSASGLTIATGTMTLPAFSLYILRHDISGTPNGTSVFTTKFAFIGLELTAGQQANLSTLSLALQTALGR